MLLNLLTVPLLAGLWLVILYVKYNFLMLTSHAYWHYANLPWIADVVISLVAAMAIFILFSSVANIFGISLFNGLTASASRDKYTVTTYKGEIREGFFSDTVKITPQHRETSEYDETNKFFGFFMLLDAVLFYIGFIPIASQYLIF